MIFELSHCLVSNTPAIIFESSEKAYQAYDLLKSAFPESVQGCNSSFTIFKDGYIACYGQYENCIIFN